MKRVWDELLTHAGVTVWLHAMVVDVESGADGRLIGVVIWTRCGFFRIRARRLIDTSGDADLCHHAGVPYEKAGDIDPAQTLTTTFRMSNVDLDAYERAGGKKMLMERMAEVVDKETCGLPRKAGSLHRMNATG